MINSIQQFLEYGVANLQKATAEYSKDPTDFAGFVYKVRDETLHFALVGSSTEGHIYHVLSSRMSCLAMGWSRKGADRMARLRAYHFNRNDMLELAQYQKRRLKKAAGTEETTELISGVRRTQYKHPAWGKYVDAVQVELSEELKKWMSIGMHSYIWKLFEKGNQRLTPLLMN